MSRRKAFDTGLTDAEPKPRPAQSKPRNPPQPRNTGSSSRKTDLPPRVPAPDPRHTSAQVPTTEGSSGVPEADDQAVVAKVEDGHAAGAESEEGDDETCIICAEPVTYYSVGICGHRTCQ